MSVKIHISYLPDDKAAVDQAVAYLKRILPGLKYHENTDKPPYIHAYFSPPKGRKPTK
jgi:hypothetical protein